MRYVKIDLYTHKSRELKPDEVKDAIDGLKKKESKHGPTVYSGEEWIVIVCDK